MLRNKIKLLALILSVLCAITACQNKGSSANNVSWEELQKKYGSNLPYEISSEIKSILPTESLTYKTSVTNYRSFEVREKFSTPTPIMVFADMDLETTIRSYPQLGLETTDTSGEIKVDPTGLIERISLSRGMNIPSAKESSIDLAVNSWGLYNAIYVAEFNDLTTGKLLPKPKVTLVKIDHTKDALNAPNNLSAATVDGRLQLDWDSTDNAIGYLIVKQKISSNPNNKIYNSNSYIALSQATSPYWISPETDVIASEFRGYNRYTEEDLYSSRNQTPEKLLEIKEELNNSLAPYYIFVIAYDSHGKFSLPSNKITSTEFIGDIPVSRALHFEKTEISEAEKVSSSGLSVKYDDVNKLPETLPYVMADGKIKRLAISYDTKSVEEKEINKRYGLDPNKRIISIKYHAKGTPAGYDKLAAYEVLEESPKSYVSKLEAKIKSIDLLSNSGALASDVPVKYDDNIAIDDSKVSKTSKQIDIPYAADSALEEYLITNIYSGTELLDMSAFPVAQDKNSLYKVINKLTLKNNLGLDAGIQFYYSSKKQILVIKYYKEDSKKEREQLTESYTLAKNAVKEIIKDGMSDTEKSVAINEYIKNKASYNYDALKALDNYNLLKSQNKTTESEAARSKLDNDYRNSFTAYGVLHDGSAVCAGYTSTYYMMAKAAGLEAAYVTGGTSGSSLTKHSWNLVKIDNKWLVVDTTWNDIGSTENSYLNIPQDTPIYANSHYLDETYKTKYPK
ncbi:MAG: transglutaminase domain-containing protein [Propionibacteriaceae bacterium]